MVNVLQLLNVASQHPKVIIITCMFTLHTVLLCNFFVENRCLSFFNVELKRRKIKKDINLNPLYQLLCVTLK